MPHPLSAPVKVSGVQASLLRMPGGRVLLRYRVEGASRLLVSAFKGRGRSDGLWKTTCFELFLAAADTAYREFNFSPSGEWAAYAFSAEREGMRDFEPIAWPEISSDLGQTTFIATAILDERELMGWSRAGLSAVLEEDGGVISYWALSHPSQNPDFHNPACFTAMLEAPGAV